MTLTSMEKRIMKILAEKRDEKIRLKEQNRLVEILDSIKNTYWWKAGSKGRNAWWREYVRHHENIKKKMREPNEQGKRKDT